MILIFTGDFLKRDLDDCRLIERLSTSNMNIGGFYFC